MKIAIGSDHVGIDLKQNISDYLSQKGYEVYDVGAFDDKRTDYPLYAKKVSEAIQKKHVELGILICGTGIGMSIAANKQSNIRAAVCSEPYSAKLSREHNDSNVLCFGSRVVGENLAKMIVDSWLETEFESGRHEKRVKMLEEDNNEKFSY